MPFAEWWNGDCRVWYLMWFVGWGGRSYLGLSCDTRTLRSWWGIQEEMVFVCWDKVSLCSPIGQLALNSQRPACLCWDYRHACRAQFFWGEVLNKLDTHARWKEKQMSNVSRLKSGDYRAEEVAQWGAVLAVNLSTWMPSMEPTQQPEFGPPGAYKLQGENQLSQTVLNHTHSHCK